MRLYKMLGHHTGRTMNSHSIYHEAPRYSTVGGCVFLKLLRLAMLGLCCIGMFSCSGDSGSWDDDSKNWSRAFSGQTLPPDVKVLHSRYWKSPHFTYEAEYFFEFTAPHKFIDDWISHEKLVLTLPTKENTPPYFHKPDWFTPRTLDEYEMWQPANAPNDKFRLYRDRSTGTLFVTDCST